MDIQRGSAQALRIAGVCPLAVAMTAAPRAFVSRRTTAALATRQPLGPFLVELLPHPGYHLGSEARCLLHFAALFDGYFAYFSQVNRIDALLQKKTIFIFVKSIASSCLMVLPDRPYPWGIPLIFITAILT